MKKILLGVGALLLVFGGEKVYAYIQDCPKRVPVNVEESRNQGSAYNNTYHHEEEHRDYDDSDCNKTNHYENKGHSYETTHHNSFRHHSHSNHH